MKILFALVTAVCTAAAVNAQKRAISADEFFAVYDKGVRHRETLKDRAYRYRSVSSSSSPDSPDLEWKTSVVVETASDGTVRAVSSLKNSRGLDLLEESIQTADSIFERRGERGWTVISKKQYSADLQARAKAWQAGSREVPKAPPNRATLAARDDRPISEYQPSKSYQSSCAFQFGGTSQSGRTGFSEYEVSCRTPGEYGPPEVRGEWKTTIRYRVAGDTGLIMEAKIRQEHTAEKFSSSLRMTINWEIDPSISIKPPETAQGRK